MEKKGVLVEYFNCLPSEIKLDILSRLPVEWVLECKSVCRSWRSLIRRPLFSKMHSRYHLNHPAASDSGKLGFIGLTCENENFRYFEYNENHESIERIKKINFNLPFGGDTRIIGSSNGLICLSRRCSEDKTCIFNPITREYVILPGLIKRVGIDSWAKGFGYVPSTNEYKVVTVMSLSHSNFVEAYIYTLGSGNGWRNLGQFNYGRKPHLWEQGMFVNGALYWWDSPLKMIVTFDLAEEKFREHLSPPAPVLLNTDCDNYCRLWVLNGCLYFSIEPHVNRTMCLNLWVLKTKDDSHGMEEREEHQSLGWSEVFRITGRLGSELLAITKSYNALSYNQSNFNIHDPETSTWKYILDLEEYFDEVFAHKNTLVSLKELGEEDAKIVESVEIAETESHSQPFNQL